LIVGDVRDVVGDVRRLRKRRRRRRWRVDGPCHVPPPDPPPT
jgi:hypothetical protein